MYSIDNTMLGESGRRRSPTYPTSSNKSIDQYRARTTYYRSLVRATTNARARDFDAIEVHPGFFGSLLPHSLVLSAFILFFYSELWYATASHSGAVHGAKKKKTESKEDRRCDGIEGIKKRMGKG